jgi:predicted small lipoprotein YifL
MSPTTVNLRLIAVGAIAILALSLDGCGKIGPLQQPAPLFGARAKAQYQADKQQAQAASQAGGAPRDTTGSAERQVDAEPVSNAPVSNSTRLENSLDNQIDDAPRTTRDVKDPDTLLTLPRNSPVPGAPNPGGTMPDLTPPT